jgi:hypothetical protein
MESTVYLLSITALQPRSMAAWPLCARLVSHSESRRQTAIYKARCHQAPARMRESAMGLADGVCARQAQLRPYASKEIDRPQPFHYGTIVADGNKFEQIACWEGNGLKLTMPSLRVAASDICPLRRLNHRLVRIGQPDQDSAAFLVMYRRGNGPDLIGPVS